MARTEAEIVEAIKDYQMAAHPRLRDYTPLSVLTALNGALASQVRYIEQQNDAVAMRKWADMLRGSFLEEDVERQMTEKGLGRVD